MISLSLVLFIPIILAGMRGSPEEAPQDMEGLPLLLTEDFSSTLGSWQFTDRAAWKQVEDDGGPALALFQASQYEPPVRSPFNLAVYKDLKVSDFILEVKVKSTSREYGHRDACVAFGWNDQSHFYYVHLAPAPRTDPHANSIFLVNNEPRVSIAQDRNDGTTWRDDVYHTIRIKRDSSSGSIVVYFDDMQNPVMQAIDKTFTSGQIGLGSFDDTALFKDLRIWGKQVH